MGAKNSKKKFTDTISISPVYEKSLSSNSAPNDKNEIKDDDITKEIKEEIILPIENEYAESPEIIFETKEELQIKNFFENNEVDNLSDNNDCLNKFFPDDLFNVERNRSKTFVPKMAILEAPRLHPKTSYNLYMSPFQLSKKSFGIVPKWNQKPNKIYLDYTNDKIDCKSCNDKEDLLDEYLIYYSDTEKTTPNLEDLQNLLNCRKKMIKFRNSINYKHYHEYENILNCEDIFEDIQDNHHHSNSKKQSSFKKHLKFQLNKNKNLIHSKKLNSVSFPGFKLDYDDKNNLDEIEDQKEDEKEEDKEDDNGLFILGVIESAVKERKRTKSTKSVVVK